MSHPQHFFKSIVRMLFFFSILGMSVAMADDEKIPTPKVLDDRLKIELFASDPQIVTPVGLATDRKGRVLVIESHTHFRPDGYKGPKNDRLRWLEDTDGDGRADLISTFYEGTKHTMNLAFGPDGAVYVATRNELFRLRDTNGDGKADQRTEIARLETKGDYPHNGLSGFAFDHRGHMYFGFGENLGADYRLIGSDGRTLSGGGEGGNIYRCRLDGSHLTRVATGFWNPFHLSLDIYGRLFTVDNDPDSRPPCRILHVVPGGDYGFRFRLGRAGLHPFISWDGEVPGTLPLLAGTGEAPCAIVNYESDGLPANYLGKLLVTSWGDHRLASYEPKLQAGVMRAIAKPFVQGGTNFRPVGMVVASEGSLYITDWVDRSYDLHGKGRIWRISLKAEHRVSRPSESAFAILSRHRPLRRQAARKMAQTVAGLKMLHQLLVSEKNIRIQAAALEAILQFDKKTNLNKLVQSVKPEMLRMMIVRDSAMERLDLKPFLTKTNSNVVRAAALRRLSGDQVSENREAVLNSLATDDPFLRQAARLALARSPGDWNSRRILSIDDPRVRLGLLLALRDKKEQVHETLLPTFLKDRDSRVRFAAVQWIGQRQLKQYGEQLPVVFKSGPTPRPLFDAFLATLEMIDGSQGGDKWDQRREKQVAALLLDEKSPTAIRRLALRTLRPDHPALSMALLRRFASSDQAELRTEAIRVLGESSATQASQVLLSMATNKKGLSEDRAEAIVQLDPKDAAHHGALIQIATSQKASLNQTILQRAALRTLSAASLSADDRRGLARIAKQSPANSGEIKRLIAPDDFASSRPASNKIEEWLKISAGEGNARAGRRVFFNSARTGCGGCHQIEGRGGIVGPDLTVLASSMTRRRIIESILVPEREIAPRYVPWAVQLVDGEAFSGIFLGEDGERNQLYADAQGKEIRVTADEIERREPISKSLMPEDLAKRLTASELRDLIVFLMDRRK